MWPYPHTVVVQFDFGCQATTDSGNLNGLQNEQ